MNKAVVHRRGRGVGGVLRQCARNMLAEALQAEVDDYIARFSAELDENGRRLVVRNGTHQPVRS